MLFFVIKASYEINFKDHYKREWLYIKFSFDSSLNKRSDELILTFEFEELSLLGIVALDELDSNQVIIFIQTWINRFIGFKNH
jgi:hypothetical protein